LQEKNNASLVMGILSIILAFVFPLVGPILGILGLVLASSNQRESGLDYTTEKILSILGIVLSVVNCLIVISQLSGIN
jgi:heme/copper-type cytochrome/quinol oxidase subunit 2